ncbi:MAG TPA: TIGR03667 family PPOX class F420-dependent oxidoreductase [Gaiellales bacterium]|jgi:PPOX class probable F420-dependent enzyme|nr:TIGR03667 family PPOX class F420-dependent oxidoreductase [Gaiellales bacterium]
MPFTIDTSTPFGRRTERRLREEKVAWLVTTSDDLTPQPVPVWFLWDRPASFLLYSKPGTAKLRNVAERPRVALHLDGNGEGGDVVVVLGAAALSDDPPAHQVPAYVEKYAGFIARNSWTPESFAADYSVPVRIEASRLRGF